MQDQMIAANAETNLIILDVCLVFSVKHIYFPFFLSYKIKSDKYTDNSCGFIKQALK